MKIKTYNPKFWLDFFQEKYAEFANLYDGQTVITNAENVFKSTDKPFDLTINFTTEICTDSNQQTFPIIEFIALKAGMTHLEVDTFLDVEYE